MLKPFIITIDGPAGVGKSTIAKKLADAFNISMLDTGAMYRTLGIKLGSEIVDLEDDKVESLASSYLFTLDGHSADAHLMCNDEDVYSLPIRTEKASRLSSIVAKLPVIRKVLQENQRALAQEFSLVAEGRDMGTRVFPDAQCKIFLDASTEVRAKRRYDELIEKEQEADFLELLKNITERDKADRTREIDPLKPADDALVVDTSYLSLEEVFQQLHTHIKKVLEESSYSLVTQQQREQREQVQQEKISQESKNLQQQEIKQESLSISGNSQEEHKITVACMLDMNIRTLKALQKANQLARNPFTVSELAGLFAAKDAWKFIPTCLCSSLKDIDIHFNFLEQVPAIEIAVEVVSDNKKYGEVEASLIAQITASNLCLLCKPLQNDIYIKECKTKY